jgi:hypothetical protein
MSKRDREEDLQATVGKQQKRIAELEYKLAQRNTPLSEMAPGEILLGHARGEINADASQLYAAKALLDREPRLLPGEYTRDAVTGAVLILPSNGRDLEIERKLREEQDDEAVAWHREQLDRLAREEHRQWDVQLRQWIAEGKLHEDCALLCRSQWLEDGDHPWQPADAVTSAPAPVQYIAPPVIITAPVPPQSFNGNGRDLRGPVKLRCNPFAWFKTKAGNEYAGGKHGLAADEIEVDARQVEDIAELIEQGCRRER